MKIALLALSFVYMALGLLMMLAAFALVYASLQSGGFGVEFIIAFAIFVFMVIFALIFICCGYNYFKRKDLKSAYNISFLAGVVTWFVVGSIYSENNGQLPDWTNVVRIIGSIIIGVCVHKFFLRYIKVYFYVKSQLDGVA